MEILVLYGAFISSAFSEFIHLVFYGVALSIARVAAARGLNRMAAETLATPFLQIGASGLLFVLAVAPLSLLLRLVLLPSQSILLLSLALIPVAPMVSIEPPVVVLTIMATSFLWFPPSLCPAYLAAYSASEGRLYSHDQAVRVNFAYMAATLAGLALSVLYWHFLGLL